MGLSQQIGASSLIRPGVIDNSTQRPASPYEGQVIYQKDTDEVLYYNGTSWSRPWNMPWGVVGYTENTTPDSTITVEELQITGGSFTAVANRYYKVTYYEPGCNAVPSATSWIGGRIRLTNISGAIKQIAYQQIPTTNVSNAIIICIWVGTLPAGTTNFVGTLQSGSGTATANRGTTAPAFLMVEDMGPA